LGRAAVVADSVRLADFAKGNFLPSAIPVEGQPFFDSDARASVQGSGSAVRIEASSLNFFGVQARAGAEFIADEATFSTGDDSSALSLEVRQVYGRFRRLMVGVMDSAFSDPSACPEVLDLAGPNARVTVFDAGTGSGQGRLSYDLLSDEPEGFEIIASVEQAIPEVRVATGDKSFSHAPDFVLATQYVEGSKGERGFEERWHVQWATVVRDIGFETPAGDDQNEFGWGTAWSGAYRFQMFSNVIPLDRVMFSVAIGEGISHYFVDLNNADDAGDAVITATGLEALPAVGAYVAYSHNWTNSLRSTATLSHVSLDSTLPLVAPTSPYRQGTFLATNLVYHLGFIGSGPTKPKQNLFVGTEYLFGNKETLDGATGDAHRVMFVVAISK
jgi:hypothetical protein